MPEPTRSDAQRRPQAEGDDRVDNASNGSIIAVSYEARLSLDEGGAVITPRIALRSLLRTENLDERQSTVRRSGGMAPS
jgi:hypothetical protein